MNVNTVSKTCFNISNVYLQDSLHYFILEFFPTYRKWCLPLKIFCSISHKFGIVQKNHTKNGLDSDWKNNGKMHFFFQDIKNVTSICRITCYLEIGIRIIKREEKQNRKILYRKLSGACLPVNDMNVINSL